MAEQVVLSVDTNILLKTQESSPYWKLLREYIAKSRCTVEISRVVLDEYSSKLLEQLERKASEAEKIFELILGLQNAGATLRSKNSVDVTHLVKELENFEISIPERGNYFVDFVNPKIEALFGTKVSEIPYPTIGHKEVVERLLDVLPPFKNKEKDKGYRDYLIWRGLVDKNSSNQELTIYFISENTNDFAGEDKQSFHSDLLAECLAPEKLTLYVSVDKFIEEIVKPHLNKLSETLKTLQNTSALDFLDSQFRTKKSDFEEVGRHFAGYKFRTFAELDNQFSFACSANKVVLVRVDDVVEMAAGQSFLDCIVSVSYNMHVIDVFSNTHFSTVPAAFALTINCKIAVDNIIQDEYRICGNVEIVRCLFDRVITASISLTELDDTIKVSFTGQAAELSSIKAINREFLVVRERMQQFLLDFGVPEKVQIEGKALFSVITTEAVLEKWTTQEKN